MRAAPATLLAAVFTTLLASSSQAQQPAKWRLVEEWRVGGAVEGAHSFGDVRGMGILPDGRIVLIDYKDQQVHFLDAKGQPVRTTGRKGAGPGEYQQANGLTVSAKGDVLINDPSTNRLTLLAPNGDLVRTIPITNRWGFQYTWDGFYNDSGRLDEFVSMRKSDAQQSTPARRVWSADFSTIDTIMPAVCPNAATPNPADFIYSFRNASGGTNMSIPYLSPQKAMVRSRNGATWAGRYPGYGTVVRTPAGKCEPDVTIQLRGSRVSVPSAARDSSVNMVRGLAARYSAPAPDTDKIPREYPFYEALFLDGSNRLWVERRVDTKARRFEVFSASGALLADVASPVVFIAYRPLIITNDRVMGFIADEDDVVHLASFRIVRG